MATASLVADTWMHGEWGWGWMVVMMGMMLLFWAAVVVGIVWLVRGTAERRPDPPAASALDVLQRRLAEGAISVEEYETRRKALVGTPAAH